MPTSTPLELNRTLFIKWTEGILLERDRNGKCIVLDGAHHFEALCEQAVLSLNKGETVYLTEGGRRVTQLTQQEGAYVEKEVENISPHA